MMDKPLNNVVSTFNVLSGQKCSLILHFWYHDFVLSKNWTMCKTMAMTKFQDKSLYIVLSIDLDSIRPSSQMLGHKSVLDNTWTKI